MDEPTFDHMRRKVWLYYDVAADKNNDTAALYLLREVSKRVGWSISLNIRDSEDTPFWAQIRDLSDPSPYYDRSGMTAGEAAIRCAYFAIPEGEWR